MPDSMFALILAGGSGERFPRRRRRPHSGPRPDNNMAGAAPAGSGDDFNPGNE